MSADAFEAFEEVGLDNEVGVCMCVCVYVFVCIPFFPSTQQV